ncbi:hypothetical protein HER10_EVM0013166 [Colletotrichum scovillei]|uniref:Uncharacterized protein n=1 Tax=Colletotrichum scovillei TaxID=1209932 RepID=A0A9P7QYL5_9PEZI|nr:uncharacterized protein HER10_EVM0013166 [Colletotrichum scovillei]KAF4784844.1 hypothetical protein HER10_EVM0013166 [Colletotrichum scovillei]KAG7044386.1 hypothetical protein JMJ77_0003848 [Colletotrichum scovillei]KAG7049096.1 hypothetical protein JMJ78_0013079 [Colletotrichum scovillei]KAG7063838.1 hypothetical protein JMJ76_0006886 [Colletotrichum scovillei]
MANTISPASIPPITQLREQLDYGDPHLPRCQAFYDSVRAFRKTYETSQGWEGNTIHEWRIREHRSALAEMARAFLELHGNGQLFWPDDNTKGKANKFKYSTDGARIRRIMQQLFWRLNLQQHRNEKYKKNKEKASSVDRMSGRGLSHEDPIDVDVFEDRPESPSTSGKPSASSSNTFVNSTIHPQHTDPSVIDPNLGDAEQRLPDERAVGSDPYRVPESPEIHVQNAPQDLYTFASISSAAPNDDRQFAPYADMGPPPKRPRLDKAKPSRIITIKAPKKPRAEKPAIGLRTHRSSPRKRTIRQQPNSATPEQLLELDSPPSSEIADDLIPSEPQPVPDAALSTGLRVRLNPFRATVENVTDEEFATNAYVDERIIQLRKETEMHQPQPEETCNKNEPPAPVQPAEAAPDTPLTPHPTVTAAPQNEKSAAALPEAVKSAEAIVQQPPSVQQPPPIAQQPPIVDRQLKDASVRPLEVDFMYRVVTSYPTRQSCIWEPEGSFRSKTLAEVVEELPKLPLRFEWSELNYLLFRLEARNTAVAESVPCGKEGKFESLKRSLTRFIRACIAETPPGESLSVLLEIEPLTSLDAVKKAEELEDIDFDW